MGRIESIKNRVRNIPEFSSKNYNIIGYFFATLITLTGIFLIYKVVTTDALVFKANWNMFKSPLGNLCWIIGFFGAIIWWGKFGQWSSTPVVETRDRYTGKLIERKEDYDISEQLFAKILMPFLGHFVIEPIIYGAIIYYSIQCIIAVVGSIFPYILSLIVLLIIVVSWMFTRLLQFRYHSVVLVAAGILFTVAFAWGSYAIDKNEPDCTTQMLTSGAETPADDVESIAMGANKVGCDGEQREHKEMTEESAEEEENQFEGYGEEGLYGSLPEGTTIYAGNMEGISIEFIITKSEEDGTIKAIYKNVRHGTTIFLTGESLPADGGNISFYGKDENLDWFFYLSGDAENITGTVQSADKQMTVTLHKK